MTTKAQAGAAGQPRLRALLEALPAYVPGRKTPGAVVLASNESPYGLLPAVADVLAEQVAGTSRYPDMSADAQRICQSGGVACRQRGESTRYRSRRGS